MAWWNRSANSQDRIDNRALGCFCIHYGYQSHYIEWATAQSFPNINVGDVSLVV